MCKNSNISWLEIILFIWFINLMIIYSFQDLSEAEKLEHAVVWVFQPI